MWRKPFSKLRALTEWIGAGEQARLRRAISWLILAAVFAYLVVQLQQIGWAHLWATRPRAPLYYLLVALAYLNLPFADTTIYRRLWRVPLGATFVACLRKRIFNSALVDYTGELGLLLWARHRVAKPAARLAHEIKDSNILSAMVSNFATAGLIVYLLLVGDFWRAAGPMFDVWAVVTLGIALLTPVALLLRRRFMVLDGGSALAVMGTHAARLLVGQALLMGQWHVVLPGVGLAALVTLLAVQMLVSRIPMVPSRDLLFVTIGIAMAGSLELPRAEIASLLITTGALQQALHLLVLLVTSFGNATPQQPSPALRQGAAE